jgi:hypothetical protein
MPYDPLASTTRQRNLAFIMVWVGAASTLVLIGFALLSTAHAPMGLFVGFSAGGLLASTLRGRNDDGYFHQLCSTGHRMACAYAALCLLAVWLTTLLDPTGVITSGPIGLMNTLSNPYFIALGTAAAFYTGYAFAWLRDRF